MKKETPSFKNLAIPAALLPFLAPMAAFAAEGTGRVSPMNARLRAYSSHGDNTYLTPFSTIWQAFGIDDGRLIFAALAPSVIIFPLYLQWSGQQETDDFFDGYEKRRQG